MIVKVKNDFLQRVHNNDSTASMGVEAAGFAHDDIGLRQPIWRNITEADVFANI